MGRKRIPAAGPRGRSGRLPKAKVVAYIRTSSKANQDRGGKTRAKRATAAAAKGFKVQIKQVLHEVVSGCKPIDARPKLAKLFAAQQSHNVKLKVFTESVRDVARDLFVGEAIHQAAKAKGIQIIPADNPNAFSHNETPSNKMLRRMMLLWAEFFKDTTVYQLQNGIRDAMESTTERTQDGKPKVTGRRTILHDIKLTVRMKVALKKVLKSYDQSKIGVRTLAKEMSSILKLEHTIGIDTAKRMKKELSTKRLL